jgi:hypothetical protein
MDSGTCGPATLAAVLLGPSDPAAYSTCWYGPDYSGHPVGNGLECPAPRPSKIGRKQIRPGRRAKLAASGVARMIA